MTGARPDLADEVVEPGAGDALSRGREQFVHGLLDSLHRDGGVATERRVGRVLAALPGAPARRLRFPWRVVSGMAAAVVLVAVLIFGFLPQRSAMAMVRDSIAASRKAGDRRYEIRVLLEQREAPLATAVLDVRDPDHYVLRIAADNGEKITMGRDAQGDWAIKRTGEIDRLPPRWLMSHWTSFGGGTVVLMTVDDLLDKLRDSYDLARGPARALAGKAGPYDRVTAMRQGEGADPARVELWLDQRSHLIEHLEMFWNPGDGPAADTEPGPAGDRRRDGPGGRRRPPAPDGELDGRPPPPPDHGDRPLPGGGQGPMPRPPNYSQYVSSARSAVFDLVPVAPFVESWFDPVTHAAPQGR